MAAMMMRGGMNNMMASSPVYSKRPDFSRMNSLRDHYLQNDSVDAEIEYDAMKLSPQSETEDVDDVPVLSNAPSQQGAMSKFSRAMKRLKNARRASVGNNSDNSKAHHNRVLQLVTREDVRHDVAKLERSAEKHLELALGAPTSARRLLVALDPASPFMICWNLIQFILFCYVILYIPYRVSFSTVGELFFVGSECGKDDVIEGMDLFVDTFYLVDLVVSACTQTVNDRGIPMILLKHTIPNYVLSWVFLRDVAPAVPMSWIEFAASSYQDCNSSTAAQSMGLGPDSSSRNSNNDNLIKLLRIMRIFRILRVFKLLNVEFISRLARLVDPNLKTLGMLFVALTVLVHLLACLWFFIKKDSTSITAWYEEQGLSSGYNRPIRIYLACVYYIIATLATVGFGDISADHTPERIVSVVIMLIGTIVFALIISTASMIVQSSSTDDAAHGAKIALVHSFCSTWKLHEDLKNQILDFFLASKSVFLENTNSKAVMTLLPIDYQCSVAPFLAKECILRTSLFKGCNPEFLSLLLELLSLESFNANEVIFQSGDVAHSIYIIKSGTCLAVNDCGMTTAEFSDTDIFGEVSCFFSLPRSYTCVCTKFCEVYVLSTASVASIFKIFPDFFKHFSAYCRKKMMIDMSTKRQLSCGLLHATPPVAPSSPLLHSAHINQLLHSQPPPLSASAPTSSPALCLQARPLSPKKLEALPPLPKGKFKPPKIPEVPEMIRSRMLQQSHGERVKLVAEIQMSLSNFDFYGLAVRYDRIMNSLHGASHGASLRVDATKKSRQVEVLASVLKIISQIASSYDLTFRFDSKKPQALKHKQFGHSCSLHLVPGGAPWNEDSSATINVDNSNGDQFFGFLMSMAGKKHATVMLDRRDSDGSSRVVT